LEAPFVNMECFGLKEELTVEIPESAGLKDYHRVIIEFLTPDKTFYLDEPWIVCERQDLTAQNEGYNVFLSTLDVGTYQVQYIIDDGRGNEDRSKSTFFKHRLLPIWVQLLQKFKLRKFAPVFEENGKTNYRDWSQMEGDMITKLGVISSKHLKRWDNLLDFLNTDNHANLSGKKLRTKLVKNERAKKKAVILPPEPVFQPEKVAPKRSKPALDYSNIIDSFEVEKENSAPEESDPYQYEEEEEVAPRRSPRSSPKVNVVRPRHVDTSFLKSKNGFEAKDGPIILIPPGVAGKIIGSGGANVKKIKQDTGAAIDIGYCKEGDPFQFVHIRGEYECREEAIGPLFKLMCGFEDYADSGPVVCLVRFDSPISDDVIETCADAECFLVIDEEPFHLAEGYQRVELLGNNYSIEIALKALLWNVY